MFVLTETATGEGKNTKGQVTEYILKLHQMEKLLPLKSIKNYLEDFLKREGRQVRKEDNFLKETFILLLF